jgi:hypothetical protein
LLNIHNNNTVYRIAFSGLVTLVAVCWAAYGRQSYGIISPLFALLGCYPWMEGSARARLKSLAFGVLFFPFAALFAIGATFTAYFALLVTFSHDDAILVASYCALFTHVFSLITYTIWAHKRTNTPLT